MKNNALLEFDHLSKMLLETSSKPHPSQVHGIISGLLCGEAGGDTTAWESLVTGDQENTQVHEILQALYHHSRAQLVDFSFEFNLILPEDNASLAERAEALTLWCQGFLTGLKLSGVPIEGRDESELTEGINDLIEIAKMNYEQVVEAEEDEHAFAELVEYVRMVVIFVFQELTGSLRDDEQDQRQLH